MKRLFEPLACAITWPSRWWILWLIYTRLIWSTLTGLVTIAVIYGVINQFYTGNLTWDFPLTSPLYGWWFIIWVVWLYWGDQLKGIKPHISPGCHYLSYFSYQGRHLLWRALLHMYHDGSTQLTSAHLIGALLVHSGTRISLLRLGITSADLQAAIHQENLPYEDFLKSATELAVSERSHISWDDLLRAFISISPNIKQFLDSKKITLDEAVAVVDWSRDEIYRHTAARFQFHSRLGELVRPKRNLNKSWTARPTPILDQYSQNLTDLARVGLLTSARVRSSEVEDAVRILSRNERNNLVLVGEPGVGKVSVVGDIALRMLQGQITALTDFKLVALDIGAMIASKVGFDKLFSGALAEATNSANTILFIGNIDQLSRSKTTSGFDVSAVLVSALDKSGLQIVATSDPTNFKKYIENNETLSQKFARLDINELDAARAILVLEDLSYQIEARQGVIITLAAIKSAVELSQKLIHTSKLPDKAMDILDEAAVFASRGGRRQVVASDIEQVMSTKTNVPVGNISSDEREKLSNLEAKIHTRMIGQNEAVIGVTGALKRARMEVSANRKRPIGSFLFLGPTGVGKTELAKSLAWSYFGDDTKMIRLDMSEYQTSDSVSRLLGAPVSAGDVALSGGQFTEAVKAMPFAVVLLDEIEKAHPDILNLFLQVLDEGTLTDNLGHTTDFTHTIIIATSNAQARFIEEAVRTNVAYDTIQKQMRELLVQESFRPEFINRFDGVVIFKPLTTEQILAIAKLKLAKLQRHLLDTKQIDLQVDDAATSWLATHGFDPAFGARPLERLIRDKIETKVANELLASPDTKAISVTVADLQ